MPEIELEPDLVLLVFLPPLLYAAAFFSDLRALRRTARAISLTAIGLVLLTMARRRRDRPRGDRPDLAAGLRARRDRLADRSGGGDGDHAPARRAAAARQPDRGREPRQRRDRAGRLPGRRRGGASAAASRCSTPASSSSARRRAASRSASPSATSSARSGGGSTTRRPSITISLLHRLRRVHPGRRAGPLRSAGGGHLRALPRLARAGDRVAADAARRASPSGRSSSSCSTRSCSS